MNKQATIIGFFAIFLWSSLALFTTQVESIPPLLSLAITFGIASIFCLVINFIRGDLLHSWKKTPHRVKLLGGLSFFFYHFCYFYAFQHMPSFQAGIITSVWPLLIVLMMARSKGKTIKWGHLIGASIAFLGTVMIIHSGSQLSTIQNTTRNIPETQATTLAYVAAVSCSLIWGGYALINRQLSNVPSCSILWYCLITTVLAIISHFMFEVSVWTLSQNTWISLIGLGFGPIGIAFFCWDIGVKHGNLSLLGVLCFTAPGLSVIWLALFGSNDITHLQLTACFIIACGALFACFVPNKGKKMQDESK